MEVSLVYILLISFVLDEIFGDPRKLPHLIVYFGKSISFFEKTINKDNHRLIKGMVTSFFLVVLAFVLPYFTIDFLIKMDYIVLYYLFSILMLFYCLANRTLIKEGKAVFDILHQQGIVAGRKRLSWIVGRDTSSLNENQIRIATLETLSENLSDGVIAPLFYFALFGVPGAMTYKMINTLDSMVGYKNERYEQYGKFAAKLDDVVNYIPARLTGFLMLLVGGKAKGFSFLIKEGKKHTSPNAGYPEAALAYILNCRFGGGNYYGGKYVEKPFIGTNERKVKPTEINQVVAINQKTSIFFVVMIVGFLLLKWY